MAGSEIKSAASLKDFVRRWWIACILLLDVLTTNCQSPSSSTPVEKAPPIRVSTNDWQWWRGPTRDNKSTHANPPLRWGPSENIQWRVPVPGRGHASPTICRDRIFVATADEELEVLELLCFARDSGQQLWRRELQRGGFMKRHEKNSHASATPACDGESVFFPAIFEDALWLLALDFEGNLRWKKRVGRFVSSNGYGSSPVLYESGVIVASDNAGDACIAAFHRGTGEVLWKTERPKLDNFSTPVVGHVSGKDQLLICGSKMIAGYDPKSGKLCWFAESPTEVTACTMAFGENLVVGGGNVPIREFMCVRADGAGNVTETHVQWRSRKNVTYVPSPLIDGRWLYIINDGGIAHCIDLASGEEIYKERLEGDFSASPMLVDGKIFATNEKGKTFVLQAGPRFEILATNELAEAVFTTPVFLNSKIFVRSASHIFCIGERNP